MERKSSYGNVNKTTLLCCKQRQSDEYGCQKLEDTFQREVQALYNNALMYLQRYFVLDYERNYLYEET